MRRFDPRRIQAIAAIAAIGFLALALSGADTPSKKKKKPSIPPKTEETVGDLADIFHRSETDLDGVGLVVGLDNTGADPPHRWTADRLIEIMRKENIENGNELLKNPRVSWSTYAWSSPSAIAPTDRLDVDITSPPRLRTPKASQGDTCWPLGSGKCEYSMETRRKAPRPRMPRDPS